MLLAKHASAVPSTGVLGVRGTPGHPGTRPAMCSAGAELDVVFAQPGCQHHQHSSTNGLARQDTQNATKDEKMTEKRESDIDPSILKRPTFRQDFQVTLHSICTVSHTPTGDSGTQP
jgi:hypothetical protein